MRVQAQISMDHDVLVALKEECRREGIYLSDYIQEAVNSFGPLTEATAYQVRRKMGAQRRDEFFTARQEKENAKVEGTLPPSSPYKAY